MAPKPDEAPEAVCYRASSLFLVSMPCFIKPIFRDVLYLACLLLAKTTKIEKRREEKRREEKRKEEKRREYRIEKNPLEQKKELSVLTRNASSSGASAWC